MAGLKTHLQTFIDVRHFIGIDISSRKSGDERVQSRQR